jgi:hypothetical protein
MKTTSDRPNRMGRAIGTLATLAIVMMVFGGSTYAVDIDSSTDSGGGIDVTTANFPPMISHFTITSGNNLVSLLDAQANVNTEVVVSVTIEDINGWEDINFVNIWLYYDGGNDEMLPWEQNTGQNYRILCFYDNSQVWKEAAPTVDHMSVKYTNDTDSLTAIDGVHTVQQKLANTKYMLTWRFKLGEQVKQADLPLAADGPLYNNANSWNIWLSAADASTFIQQKGGIANAYEFGIYKYTYVSCSNNGWHPSFPVVPGADRDASPASLETMSNDDFDLTVWMNGDLTCNSPYSTIPTSGGYVTLLASACENDDVHIDQAFAGNLESNELFIRLNTYWGYHCFVSPDANCLYTDVNFNIAVPLGTLPGAYTADLTFQVTQSP